MRCPWIAPFKRAPAGCTGDTCSYPWPHLLLVSPEDRTYNVLLYLGRGARIAGGAWEAMPRSPARIRGVQVGETTGSYRFRFPGGRRREYRFERAPVVLATEIVAMPATEDCSCAP